MTDSAVELRKLTAICPKAELWEEGGKPLIFLPGLQIAPDQKMDALLAVYERDGYPTKLYLEKQAVRGGANWRTYAIKGRTWHSNSWGGVPADLPWREILSNHLAPLR